MSIGFPTNTVLLIIAVMIGVGAGSWLILSQGLSQIPVAPRLKRTWRWAGAIVLITWLLSRLALALHPPGGVVSRVSVTITFLGLGMLAGVLPLLISPVFRQVVRAAPQTWLVGIQTIRVAGFLFLALMDMKLLPAEFALPAGYGDMTVGVLALAMIYLLAKRTPYARGLAIGWNLLGLLDLAVALTTGILYTGPFAVQLAASGVPLLYLNYVLIVPAFGVPLFALLHLYSLFQLVSVRADETTPGVEEPVHAPGFSAEQCSVHP
jgi:hypothetical protein